MAKKKQREHSEKFRREAVRRADQPGVTAAQVAKELGIHPGQIYNWRSQYKKIERLRSGETVRHQFSEVDGNNYAEPESAELRELRKRVAELEEERDFLKKASAYFANQKK